MEFKNIKLEFKKCLQTDYSNIKTKFKKYFPTKKDFYETLVTVSIGTYLGLAFLMGDFNPLTMRKTVRQREIKWKEEQKIQENIRESNEKKLENLLELRQKVLEKAEKLDGLAGLTFPEEAELAKKLGYKGVFIEGEIKKFGLGISNLPDKGLVYNPNDYLEEPQAYLKINNEKITISEETLRDYLLEN